MKSSLRCLYPLVIALLWNTTATTTKLRMMVLENSKKTLYRLQSGLSLLRREKRSPGMVVHDCNPSTQKAEAGRLRIQG
jgi:hypothetical protein